MSRYSGASAGAESRRWSIAVSLLGAMSVQAAGAARRYPAVDQPGVTAKEIKVGGVASISNDPTGASLGSAFDGMKAYFAMVNSKGGVYGRKLVLDSEA